MDGETLSWDYVLNNSGVYASDHIGHGDRIVSFGNSEVFLVNARNNRIWELDTKEAARDSYIDTGEIFRMELRK